MRCAQPAGAREHRPVRRRQAGRLSTLHMRMRPSRLPSRPDGAPHARGEALGLHPPRPPGLGSEARTKGLGFLEIGEALEIGSALAGQGGPVRPTDAGPSQALALLGEALAAEPGRVAVTLGTRGGGLALPPLAELSAHAEPMSTSS